MLTEAGKLELRRERQRIAARRWYVANSERVKAAAKKWRLAHAEHERARHAARYLANPERFAAAAKKCKQAHPEKCRRYSREWQARQRKERPNFRILCSLRQRIYSALCGQNRSARTISLLGCDVEHLKVWLTFYFQPGMSWSNYGSVWHVDHIRPCASFDMADPAQQKECFHYTNLQPLFVKENLKKGSKILT